MAAEGRKLVYHSEPFTDDTEVSGFFRLTAGSPWISRIRISCSSIRYRDDGSAVFLTEQPYRARYREGLRVEKLIDTKEPLRYDFDRFFFVSRRIAQGHRLRLVIGPIHSIYWQKNYNSGKPVAEQSMQDARPVTVKLFHDAAHPSVLYVPIGHAED